MSANNFNDTVLTAVRYAGLDENGQPNAYAGELEAMGIDWQQAKQTIAPFERNSINQFGEPEYSFDVEGASSALQATMPTNVMDSVAGYVDTMGTAKDEEQKNSGWDQGPMGGFGTALAGTALIAGAGALGGAFDGGFINAFSGGAGDATLAGEAAGDVLAGEAAGVGLETVGGASGAAASSGIESIIATAKNAIATIVSPGASATLTQQLMSSAIKSAASQLLFQGKVTPEGLVVGMASSFGQNLLSSAIQAQLAGTIANETVRQAIGFAGANAAAQLLTTGDYSVKSAVQSAATSWVVGKVWDAVAGAWKDGDTISGTSGDTTAGGEGNDTLTNTTDAEGVDMGTVNTSTVDVGTGGGLDPHANEAGYSMNPATGFWEKDSTTVVDTGTGGGLDPHANETGYHMNPATGFWEKDTVGLDTVTGGYVDPHENEAGYKLDRATGKWVIDDSAIDRVIIDDISVDQNANKAGYKLDPATGKWVIDDTTETTNVMQVGTKQTNADGTTSTWNGTDWVVDGNTTNDTDTTETTNVTTVGTQRTNADGSTSTWNGTDWVVDDGTVTTETTNVMRVGSTRTNADGTTSTWNGTDWVLDDGTIDTDGTTDDKKTDGTTDEDRSKWTTDQWNTFIKAAIAAAVLASGGSSGVTPAKTQAEIDAQTARDNAAKIASEQWQFYKDNYQPLEKKLITQATDAGSQDEFARARGAANADVTGAFDTARRNTQSRMQSYGLNPASAAYQSGMASSDLAEGATKAGALTTADNTTRALAFGKQFDVANLGRGIPSQSAAAATNAANAATSAANVAGINQNRQYLQGQQNTRNLGYGLSSIGNAARSWFGNDDTSDSGRGGGGGGINYGWGGGYGYAEGGPVIDAKETAPGQYDATALKSVMMRHGLNDATAGKQASAARMRTITPHMNVFASGGGVGRGGMPDDESNMGMPNDASMMNQSINGQGTETSDSIPAQIDGQEPAALSDGEFVVNAAAVDLTGEEMLAAINEAGLRKRQTMGLQPQTSNQVPLNAGAQAYADGGEIGYGTRLDGTQKGQGYFGALPNTKGVPSTELSFDFDVDGKKILAPLLVPTLAPQEIQHLLENKPPTESIYRKAQDHAMQRIRSGKNPFAMEGEQVPMRKMQMPAQAYARGGRVNRFARAGL